MQIFHVRGGRVRGQRGFVVEKVEDVTTADLVEHLVQQLYGDQPGDSAPGDARPRAGRRDAETLGAWPIGAAGPQGRAAVPQRGEKKRISETGGEGRPRHDPCAATDSADPLRRGAPERGARCRLEERALGLPGAAPADRGRMTSLDDPRADLSRRLSGRLRQRPGGLVAVPAVQGPRLSTPARGERRSPWMVRGASRRRFGAGRIAREGRALLPEAARPGACRRREASGVRWRFGVPSRDGGLGKTCPVAGLAKRARRSSLVPWGSRPCVVLSPRARHPSSW